MSVEIVISRGLPSKYFFDVQLNLDVDERRAWVSKRDKPMTGDVLVWPICPIYSRAAMDVLAQQIEEAGVLDSIADGYRSERDDWGVLRWIGDESTDAPMQQLEELIGKATS